MGVLSGSDLERIAEVFKNITPTTNFNSNETSYAFAFHPIHEHNFLTLNAQELVDKLRVTSSFQIQHMFASKSSYGNMITITGYSFDTESIGVQSNSSHWYGLFFGYPEKTDDIDIISGTKLDICEFLGYCEGYSSLGYTKEVFYTKINNEDYIVMAETGYGSESNPTSVVYLGKANKDQNNPILFEEIGNAGFYSADDNRHTVEYSNSFCVGKYLILIRNAVYDDISPASWAAKPNDSSAGSYESSYPPKLKITDTFNLYYALFDLEKKEMVKAKTSIDITMGEDKNPTVTASQLGWFCFVPMYGDEDETNCYLGGLFMFYTYAGYVSDLTTQNKRLNSDDLVAYEIQNTQIVIEKETNEVSIRTSENACLLKYLINNVANEVVSYNNAQYIAFNYNLGRGGDFQMPIDGNISYRNGYGVLHISAILNNYYILRLFVTKDSVNAKALRTENSSFEFKTPESVDYYIYPEYVNNLTYNKFYPIYQTNFSMFVCGYTSRMNISNEIFPVEVDKNSDVWKILNWEKGLSANFMLATKMRGTSSESYGYKWCSKRLDNSLNVIIRPLIVKFPNALEKPLYMVIRVPNNCRVMTDSQEVTHIPTGYIVIDNSNNSDIVEIPKGVYCILNASYFILY